MPASAAQVFGPVTIDPYFFISGLKTLLTMNTTLPAGGKNVIIVVLLPNAAFEAGNDLEILRIDKGTTPLYQTVVINVAHGGSRSKPILLIAVDNNPVGNDSYSFRINTLVTAFFSGEVHVQGIVIKTDDASWAYNTTAVSIANGATATVVSMATSFPVGSKVALVAVAYGGPSAAGHYLIGPGNIRLRLGTTILSSNQFAVGGFDANRPFWVSLIYLDSPATGSQTYSIEITNDSGVGFSCFAEIVAFTVFDGAILDTASVALSASAQVTVGNLSTTLSGDVVAIGLASTENTNTDSIVTFATNTVVLQLNNSTTGQIGNLVGWRLEFTSQQGRSGVLPLFRLDTDTTNPTYQIKMTANISGANGEAKILAFTISAGLAIKRSIFESMSTSEGFIFGRRRFNYLTESLSIGEFRSVFRGIKRLVVESMNLVEQLVMSRVWVKIFTENERISEVGRVLRGLMRLVVEEIRAFESATRFRDRFRSLAESLRISEAISISRHLAKAVGESVRVLEHAFKSLVVSRVISELARISEVFVSAMGKSLSVSEALNLSEAVGRLTGLVRDIIEQIGVSEASVKVRSFVKILGERLHLSEFIKVGRVAVRHISESVRIPEVVARFKGYVRVLGESLRIVEISNVTRSLMRQVGEAIRIEEAITRLRSMFRATAEGLAILEDKLMTRYVVKVVDAVMRVGEYVVGFGGKTISILEHIRILEFRRVRKIRIYVRRIVSSLRGKSRAR